MSNQPIQNSICDARLSSNSLNSVTVDHVSRVSNPAVPVQIERMTTLAFGKPIMFGNRIANEGFSDSQNGNYGAKTLRLYPIPKMIDRNLLDDSKLSGNPHCAAGLEHERSDL